MANKFLDENGLLYLVQKIKTMLNGKVSTEAGKGLSSNDYTTDEKNKLKDIAENAQANVIEDIKVNGVSVTITNKSANIGVPVNVSDLNNDENYVKENELNKVAKTGRYTDLSNIPSEFNPKAHTHNASEITDLESVITNKITTALDGMTGMSFEVVESLPKTCEVGAIYLISNQGTDNNVYDEYIYVNNKFEKIGTTDVDLSGYLQTTDIVAITNAEIDTICSA